jgi:hypothetical protein
MNLFKTQSLFKLSLETSLNLASATTTRIYYEKQSGVKGYWTATVNGTKLEYEVQNSDIDEDGLWKFQAYVVVGGRTGFGDVVSQYFEKNIL